MEDKYWENIEGKGELSVRVITAETAAVNDRRNTAPEFPMYECPQKGVPRRAKKSMAIIEFRIIV